MIPNNGTLVEINPIKLLLAMDEQNQTGILYIRKNDILKVFYLNQGKISWAISSDAEDKIEHVLLANNMVNPDALAPYLAGNQLSESFGKILVENGLISLETLINASREQLKRIATSVLFWNSGTYQLEPESPPTRLVSLELDIVPLVYHYIQTHMDVNIIWEEIGSLSGELRQIREPEKIFQYNLDADQQEVFACFREPQRPEAALLRFPAERKHSILKILYFLLVTGLLVKKEADMMSTLDFNELDSLFGQAQPEAPAEVSVEIPAMINEAEIKDIPPLDFPPVREAQRVTEVTLPELPDLAPVAAEKPRPREKVSSAPGKAQKIPPRIQPLLPEKQRSRWLSVSFLSILLAVVAIAAFLWFTRGPQKKEEPITPRRSAARVGRKTAPAQAQVQPVPETTTSPVPDPAATQVQTAKTEPLREKETTTAPADVVDRPGSGSQAFASGKFNTAADLWRQELIAQEVRFSILLEMDCLEESVRHAFQQVTDRENFFILNRVKNGRNCWLVLWGRFRTQDEAAQNLRLVPEYFFQQSSPPTVIELEQYL
jgi:hypothetical protein